MPAGCEADDLIWKDFHSSRVFAEKSNRPQVDVQFPTASM
jgi:hypothetical protein